MDEANSSSGRPLLRRPKVMFLFQGAFDTPGYYLYVLDRLRNEANVDIIVVEGVRRVGGATVTVPQWRERFGYPFVDIPEKEASGGWLTVPTLWRLLLRQRPDVVVTVPEYLEAFRSDLLLRVTRRLLRIPLILKSIPFRVPTYEEVRAGLEKRLLEEVATPSRQFGPLLAVCAGKAWLKPVGTAVGRFVQAIRKELGSRRIASILERRRRLWNLPDAHVNYVDDAIRVYGSYGVPRERIVVTRNSPDTVLLEKIRQKLVYDGVIRGYCARRIVHVGRLVEWKRVDLLLRAVALLRAEFPDIECEIIGDGPMKASWQELAKGLGVDDCVEFVGGIYDYEELGRHLMTAAIYVLAGMGGISLNDAMAFGVPVICSTCDGTEKFLVRDGENGLFFREGDAGDLARKIGTVFDDVGIRRSLAEGSLMTIRERVNVQSVIKGYLDAFSSVTAGKCNGG